jgi:hypothetical protein
MFTVLYDKTGVKMEVNIWFCLAQNLAHAMELAFCSFSDKIGT